MALRYHLATYDPDTFLVGDEIVSGTPTFVHTANIYEEDADGVWQIFGANKRVVKGGRYVSDSAVYADNGSGTLLDPLPMMVWQAAATNHFFSTDNLAKQSYWSGTGVRVTADIATAPNGLTHAAEITPNTTNGEHKNSQNVASIVGDIIYSCFAKPNGYTHFSVHTKATGSWGTAIFDIENGTVTQEPAGHTCFIEAAANGFYRCGFEVDNVNSNVHLAVGVASDGTTNIFAGDGTSSIYVWAVQVELKTGKPSNPIITTGGATASTDEIINTYPSANWSNSEGPIYIIHDYKGIDEVILLNDDVAILYVTSDVLYLDDGTNTVSIIYPEGVHRIGIALNPTDSTMDLNIDATWAGEGLTISYSDGVDHYLPKRSLDSDENSFTVGTTVKDSDGNNFTVI